MKHLFVYVLMGVSITSTAYSQGNPHKLPSTYPDVRYQICITHPGKHHPACDAEKKKVDKKVDKKIKNQTETVSPKKARLKRICFRKKAKCKTDSCRKRHRCEQMPG